MAREQRLARLAGREEEAWRDVEALVEVKRAAEYTQAVGLLNDLDALAERAGNLPAFRRRVQDFCERHRGKTALMKRVDAAGLNRLGGSGSA